MKKFKAIILAICFAVPIFLMGCENENISVLSTPQNLNVEDGIISFKMVEDADYYSISVNNMEFNVDAKHNSNVNIVDGVVNYDANKIFNYGKTYSIKIKAHANENHRSHYTDVVIYQHNIGIEMPQNVSISNKTLIWNIVEDASYYVVKVFYKTGNESTTYTCDVNFCDISASLQTFGLGEYSYCVKAVRTGANQYESEFSLEVDYVNYKQLTTPIIENIYTYSNDILMQAKVDEHANKITITCGEDMRSIMLNGTNQSVSQNGESLIINLTEIFGEEKFDSLTQYAFTIQAKYESLSVTYITNSSVSNTHIYNKTEKLLSPVLKLEFSEVYNAYIVSWQGINNSAGYNLVVTNVSSTQEYFVSSEVTQFLINNEFSNIKIMALGVGNYLDSDFSNIVSK